MGVEGPGRTQRPGRACRKEKMLLGHQAVAIESGSESGLAEGQGEGSVWYLSILQTNQQLPPALGAPEFICPVTPGLMIKETSL